MAIRRGPILIEDDVPGDRPSPAEAPPVPEASPDYGAQPSGQAMRTMAALAARKPSRLGRWFRRSAAALVGFAVSAWVWAGIETLFQRSAALGWAFTAILGLFIVTLLGLCLRELVALSRLKRVGDIHHEAETALAGADLSAAGHVADRIASLYAERDSLRWGRDRFAERRADTFDADALFGLLEAELMAPLDAAARAEVEAAARQVAAVTAVVPLAFADVAAALTANLRMIRRIAEIYGGRAGTIGAWRLTRAVFTHLVATGAVAVGDDLIGSVAGGSVLARVSRRFGEGIVNGALTARVGVAAMEVCRPLPFSDARRPKVHRIVGTALSGLFTTRE